MQHHETMKELLDERNQKLWDEISEYYEVEFIDSSNGEYGCYTESKNVVFTINKNNMCKDSFTHEMLHAYLKIHEFYIGNSIYLTLSGSKLFSSILSPLLIDHIGNCLDHIKMLPLYLELGFERQKFIQDYFEYKCTTEELRNFEKSYRTGKKINLEAVDPYIGRLVAILCDPNDKFNYSNELKRLRKVDDLLYRIIERLINHTKEIKLVDRKPFEDCYRTVSGNFYNNLKVWATQNKLTA